MFNYSSLLSKTGKIVPAYLNKITEQDKQELIDQTKFLVLNPSISDRIKAIMHNVTQHEKCKCGNYLPFSPRKNKVFKDFCSFSCAMKYKDRTEAKKKLKEKLAKKKNLIANAEIISLEELQDFIKKHKNDIKNQYDLSVLLNKNPTIRAALLFHTQNLKGGLAKRFFWFVYPHKCSYCDRDTEFISIAKGFRNSCKKHANLESGKKRKEAKITKTVDVLNNIGYKPLEIPYGLNFGHFKLKCNTCSTVFLTYLNNGVSLHEQKIKTLCPTCYPKNVSSYEIELREYIESLGLNVISQYPIEKNKYGNKTIDLFIPEANLGIEFNGLMFHSYGDSVYLMFDNRDKENKNRHLLKTKLCKEQKIDLLQIFSNEWEDKIKKEIWKSVIAIKLKKAKQKIYARNCEIKEITNDEAEQFLIKTHLQGSIKGSIRYGLFNNNELVAVAVFSKSRFSKNFNYELLRFSVKLNTVVVGGFSKLIKHFKMHNEGKLVSYANRRWSNGNVYLKCGFKLEKESSPNYFYFKPGEEKLFSRLQFQKHKLQTNLTESEFMFASGYRRIWDCGNFVFSFS